MNVGVVGAGFTGAEFIRLFNPSHRLHLEGHNLTEQALVSKSLQQYQNRLSDLAQADHFDAILYTKPPFPNQEQALIDILGDTTVGLLILISTTGVYASPGPGEDQVSWNEKTAILARSDRARKRLEHERAIAEIAKECSVPLLIIRAGGIYGYQRGLLHVLSAGYASHRFPSQPSQAMTRMLKENRPIARIHVTDLASASLWAVEEYYANSTLVDGQIIHGVEPTQPNQGELLASLHGLLKERPALIDGWRKWAKHYERPLTIESPSSFMDWLYELSVNLIEQPGYGRRLECAVLTELGYNFHYPDPLSGILAELDKWAHS